jgi:hypothetical protein
MWPLLLGGVDKCAPEWANRFALRCAASNVSLVNLRAKGCV